MAARQVAATNMSQKQTLNILWERERGREGRTGERKEREKDRIGKRTGIVSWYMGIGRHGEAYKQKRAHVTGIFFSAFQAGVLHIPPV